MARISALVFLLPQWANLSQRASIIQRLMRIPITVESQTHLPWVSGDISHKLSGRLQPRLAVILMIAQAPVCRMPLVSFLILLSVITYRLATWLVPSRQISEDPSVFLLSMRIMNAQAVPTVSALLLSIAKFFLYIAIGVVQDPHCLPVYPPSSSVIASTINKHCLSFACQIVPNAIVL
jgi:hypothetical protein